MLIYLSPEKEYIDGGGKLILQDKGYYDEVIPVDVNFAILDFSKNNPNHAVEAVKNNFVRYTYINFIERREFGPPKRYIGDEEVIEKWEPDTDVTYSSPFQIINETEEKVKKLI
mgnify:FL=1